MVFYLKYPEGADDVEYTTRLELKERLRKIAATEPVRIAASEQPTDERNRTYHDFTAAAAIEAVDTLVTAV